MRRKTTSLILRSGAKSRVSKDNPAVPPGSARPGPSFEAPSGRLRTREAGAADGLPRLGEVVAAHGLNPRKALGQNFLFDLNLTRKIARAARPLAGVAVVEIGPGPGGLTRALLSEGASKVIAIERDARALGALAEIAAHWPGRLEVIEGDALRIAPRTLVDKAGAMPIRIVANLPYNVATALLTGWLEAEPWPPFYDRLTLMFQREVARRIVATPVERAAYGRLAVLTGWRTEARILFDVAPAAFTPPPKVTSSVVELVPRASPSPCDAATLSALTQAAFGQRRKMLRQSLKSFAAARGLDLPALLAAARLESTMRAEEVDVAGFVALARGAVGSRDLKHVQETL
jgi:16S rRNA (adenine1518-N6/adenine1519-N6)-dimethyltransferase